MLLLLSAMVYTDREYEFVMIARSKGSEMVDTPYSPLALDLSVRMGQSTP